MESRIVLLLAAACLLVCVSANDNVEANEGTPQERLIALYSTFTSSRLSSTTTTVLFSCNIAPAAAATCRRRRRKRAPVAANAMALEAPEMAAPELSASQDHQKTAVADTSDANGRLFFTIWTTSYTTLTTTSSTTNFSTTLSYTLLCTASGQTLLPLCG